MERPRLEPNGFYGRIPLQPHQLTDDVTRREDVIVLCHVGVPHISRSEWSLAIDGLVDRPTRLTFDDLAKLPEHDVMSVHECAGSPLAPQEPKRRVVNVIWSGVRLVDVLAPCGISPRAAYLWSTGADYGEFAGVHIDAYVKDLPLDRISADVLIATKLNGEPVSAENGFPARLIVPGFYGTNSVKWLTRMTLSDRRADGPFTTRWYNDREVNADGTLAEATHPVWSLAPESVIVGPAPGAQLRVGQSCRIWGRAWGDAPISTVRVSLNGVVLDEAALAPRQQRAWQTFSMYWTPDRTGAFTLASIARDGSGRQQPLAGVRNSVHSVAVVVV